MILWKMSSGVIIESIMNFKSNICNKMVSKNRYIETTNLFLNKSANLFETSNLFKRFFS